MACDISNGRLEACKDSVSGIDAIYIINYGINYPTDVTFDTTPPTAGYEDVITDIQGVTTLYKFELKGANSFEQTIQSSRDNGTTFFEQVIVAQLKRQDIATHKTVKLLSYGRPHIVVRDRNLNFFLAGLERGCDVTAGTFSKACLFSFIKFTLSPWADRTSSIMARLMPAFAILSIWYG